jgi:hypothetical protein
VKAAKSSVPDELMQWAAVTTWRGPTSAPEQLLEKSTMARHGQVVMRVLSEPKRVRLSSLRLQPSGTSVGSGAPSTRGSLRSPLGPPYPWTSPEACAARSSEVRRAAGRPSSNSLRERGLYAEKRSTGGAAGSE